MLCIILILSISIDQLYTFGVKPDVYCKLQCPSFGDVHTICEYKCEISPECVNFQEFELNDRERAIILHAHNAYRQLLASGGDQRGGNGAAKDMHVLYYDKELEVAVSCWGKRCRFAHDRCRHTPSYPSAGQNLFLESSSAPINALDEKYLNTSVQNWYEEIKDTNPDVITNFAPISQTQIGHFTQVIWANTQVLGCTRVTYEDPIQPIYRYHMHLLCNYSPAGNILGYTTYARGVGCLDGRRKNQKYPALCEDPKFAKKLGDRTLPSIESEKGSGSKKSGKDDSAKIKRPGSTEPQIRSHGEITTVMEDSNRLLIVAISVCVWRWYCDKLVI